MLKITAGTHRGRVLIGMDSIRSTKCIVREAIFNIIYSHHKECLENGVVLDLYGGTGILSYEALSRGAKSAIINDVNPIHRSLAMKNAIKLSMGDKVTFVAQDATKYKSTFDDVDIIFIDPPYYKNFGGVTVDNIKNNKSSERELLIVIELCKEDMIAFNAGRDYPEPRKYGCSYLQIFSI